MVTLHYLRLLLFTKVHVYFKLPNMEPNLDSLIDAASVQLMVGQQGLVEHMADVVAVGPGATQTPSSPIPSGQGTTIERNPQGQESQGQSPKGVEALIDRILRSRKIGRAPKGQPLSGVYLEMCDRLRAELYRLLPQSLEHYHHQRQKSQLSVQILARNWSYDLIHRASQAILDDAQLKHLALEAQAHAPRTAARQHALMQLVEGIRVSGRLARPHRTKFSPQFYDLLYEEAVNRTLTYVCRRIETYDPTRGQKQKFMNWVNFRLDRMIIECRREFDDQQTESIPTLDTLDIAPEPDDSDSLADRIRECIATDAEQVFAKAHIRKHPNASFQAIALARFDGKSWEDISQEFAIKVPTLSSFFQRCCQKFAPIFHTYQ